MENNLKLTFRFSIRSIKFAIDYEFFANVRKIRNQHEYTFGKIDKTGTGRHALHLENR
jgi:hypothetical protein